MPVDGSQPQSHQQTCQDVIDKACRAVVQVHEFNARHHVKLSIQIGIARGLVILNLGSSNHLDVVGTVCQVAKAMALQGDGWIT